MNHRCLKWGKEGELSRGLSETSSSASEHYDDSILKTNGVNSQLTLPKLVLNADRQSPKPFKCQNKKILWQPPIRFPVSITAWRKTRFLQLFLLCWMTVTCTLWKLGVFLVCGCSSGHRARGLIPVSLYWSILECNTDASEPLSVNVNEKSLC